MVTFKHQIAPGSLLVTKMLLFINSIFCIQIKTGCYAVFGATWCIKNECETRNLLKTASFIYNIRPQLCVKMYLMSWLFLNIYIYAMMPKSTPPFFFLKKANVKPLPMPDAYDLSTSRFVCSQEFSFSFQSRAGARTTTKPVLLGLFTHSIKAYM